MTANTIRLRDWLRRERGLDFADYEALRRWSVEHVSDFWQALWDHFAIESPTPHERVLAAETMPGATWFPGAQVNYARHVFSHAERSDAAGHPAILFRDEAMQAHGETLEISWAELRRQVASFAAALARMGVAPGDRVCAILPNLPQTAIAFLACASLGAIWSLCAPDMGVATVRDRFRQIDPVVLIAADGTVYGGKVIDRRAAVVELLGELPTVRALILVPTSTRPVRRAASVRGRALARARAARREALGGRRARRSAGAVRAPALDRLQQRHDRPAQAIVHGHGGVMLEMSPTSPGLRPIGAGAGCHLSHVRPRKGTECTPPSATSRPSSCSARPSASTTVIPRGLRPTRCGATRPRCARLFSAPAPPITPPA
jgi:acetoacetyl-CoA synthetase